MQSALSLDGLFAAALEGRPPAAASAWLQQHLNGALVSGAANCARVAADMYVAAEPHEQQVPYLSPNTYMTLFWIWIWNSPNKCVIGVED